jgi:sugar phosphate isomerase/epimerase
VSRPLLGFCSISALDRPLAAVAELAVANGLDGIEATARPPHVDPAAPLEVHRETARAVRATGAAILTYGSYLGRAEVAGTAAVDAATAVREVRVAEALGARLLRVWAEPLPGAPEGGFAAVAALLRAACDAAWLPPASTSSSSATSDPSPTPERSSVFAAADRPNFALNRQCSISAAARCGRAA